MPLLHYRHCRKENQREVLLVTYLVYLCFSREAIARLHRVCPLTQLRCE